MNRRAGGHNCQSERFREEQFCALALLTALTEPTQTRNKETARRGRLKTADNAYCVDRALLWYPYCDIELGLAWSNDPRSYAGGSVAAGRHIKR
jgi:hypothetical protein